MLDELMSGLGIERTTLITQVQIQEGWWALAHTYLTALLACHDKRVRLTKVEINPCPPTQPFLLMKVDIISCYIKAATIAACTPDTWTSVHAYNCNYSIVAFV